jgi:predicted Fe-Mo cluster-binding NifX family protein
VAADLPPWRPGPLMRLGIPVWRSQVSPVFDVAMHLLVLDVENGREVARHVVRLGTVNEAARVQRLTAAGIDALVCGTLSSALEEMITAAGIRVVSLVSGPVEQVAASIIAGRRLPPECLMPGRRHPRARGRSWL